MSTEIIEVEAKLKPLQDELMTLQEKAETIEIKSDEDYAGATEFLSALKKKGKDRETMRKFFVDPLNAQVKSINAMFKPQDEVEQNVEKIVKGKMATFIKAKEEAAAKEQARLDSIRDAANQKREEKGQEAIAEPVRQVAPVAKTATAGTAQSTARKVWKHEVMSMAELPPDITKAILAEAWKKGIVTSVVQKFVDAGMREIPGVRVYEDTIIAIR